MFNLSKYVAKHALAPADPGYLDEQLHGLQTTVDDEQQIGQLVQGHPAADKSVDEVARGFGTEEAAIAERAAKTQMANQLLNQIREKHGPEILNRLTSSSEFRSWVDRVRAEADPSFAEGLLEQYEMEGVPDVMIQTYDLQTLSNSVLNRADDLARALGRIQPEPAFAFNLKKHKTGQVDLSTEQDDPAQFIAKFLPPLLAYSGKKGQDDARSEAAKREILKMVSPAAIEEANSPLKQIQTLNPAQVDEARKILGYIYTNWVAPCCNQQAPTTPMEPVMSKKNPKGIIKHNLSDHVVNNQNLLKIAADQFGQQYMLYGPSEKRICPKMRGRGGGPPGSGDVVPEYICRHHCLDGIIVDDNKTICGEALWRGNLMDKFSREYVDEDGNIVGGYLNKRFEINRNVPEENKMRLKPGETRKPRPPEWGNTESRMQAMRKAEGKQRDYRPDTNTGDTFNWTRDVDQNNVEQSQAQRDRREKAMGHDTVQYTNKNQQENKPRTAKGFNLKQYKEAIFTPMDAEDSPDPTGDDTHIFEVAQKVAQILRNPDINVEQALRQLQAQEFLGPNQWHIAVQKGMQLAQEQHPAPMLASKKEGALEKGARKKKDERGKSYSAYINDKNKEENWQDKKADVDESVCPSCNRAYYGAYCPRCSKPPKKKAQGGSISPVVDDGKPIEPVEPAEGKRHWWDTLKEKGRKGLAGRREQLKRLVTPPDTHPELYKQDKSAAHNIQPGEFESAIVPNQPPWHGVKGGGMFQDFLVDISQAQSPQEVDAVLAQADKIIQMGRGGTRQWNILHQHAAKRKAELGGSPMAMASKEAAVVENDDIKKIERKEFPQKTRKNFNLKEHKEAKSPPGFKHTVEHMKEEHSDEIDNPFALAWWMKNKGYESHKGPEDVHKCDDDGGKKKKKKNDDKDMKSASGYKWNFKNAQMTGPRGPFGPDNPQSDNLGLSPDYDPRDDPTMEEALYREEESSPLVDGLVSQVLSARTKEEVVHFINGQMAYPENQAEMNIHDWDDVVNAAMDHLRTIGQPELAPGEINFPKTASKKKS